MANEFQVIFASVPFCLDIAKIVRMPFPKPSPGPAGENTSPVKHQVMADLIEEIDRRIPFGLTQDITESAPYPGRNIGGLAIPWKTPAIIPDIKVGDWWYPNSASRWSIFRGFATSSQVKAMLAATGGSSQGTFVMKQNPLSPGNPANLAVNYTISTSMYLLPPRPLSEHGGKFDGLYLVTLVDERYWWQYNPVSLQVNANSTWTGLITQLATALGIVINFDPIPAVYQTPEPDSQFWTNAENAALLLDAVAYNIGSVVCRNFDGTYNLRNPINSLNIVATNRGGLVQTSVSSGSVADLSQVVRVAGGDIFNSGTGSNLPVGDLTNSRNAVLPSNVRVTFPKYVVGNDPVPHFSNPRILPPRPSCWYEESYGDTYNVDVPLSSGAGNFGSGFFISGLVGISGATHSIHSTAKALFSGEVGFLSGQTPINLSGLFTLAFQVAYDFYNQQTVSALDEVYPGIYAWIPEGFHDVIWSYSAKTGRAVTRVTRTEWNMIVREMQHSTPPPSGQIFWGSGVIAGNASGQPVCYVPPGVGGPSVAQTIQDSFLSGFFGGLSGFIISTLATAMSSGDTQANFTAVDYFPTENRWRGIVDAEIMLFEGTSGNASGVGIIYRGIDGTNIVSHTAGTNISQVMPNVSYGINLTTYEKGQFSYPHEWTSGGVQGLRIVPQMQTVQCLDGTGTAINGITHFSGISVFYDPTKMINPWIRGSLIWLTERNAYTVASGTYLLGQFGGYSASGPVAKIYSVDGGGTSGYTICLGDGANHTMNFVNGRLINSM